MNRMLSIILLIVLHASAQGEESAIPMIGMDPVESSSYVAVFVPLTEDQALIGIDWFSNDETITYPEVAVSGGEVSGPGFASSGVPVAADVVGGSTAWSPLRWSGSYGTLDGGIYVLFRLPDGCVHIGEGAGGGAAFGLVSATEGLRGWMSLEGEEWIGLGAAFGLAFRPVIVALTPETVMLERSTKSLASSEEEESIPLVTGFSTPYPNPFNPSTKLRFTLAEAIPIKLAIYNLRGQRVIQLADGVFSAGEHLIPWHGRNDQGSVVGSGVYLVRMQAGGFTRTHRLMLVR
ncbi:MAG TPA: T9SS type A sorting domain-containing protein [Candidatus Krumholzibacteria bacterium]|nr:T9SS type A sorting domain-containing protein [Candidatus Krumholzibacteria bacterium]HRX50978.1 T9SS type A sorting domain-containing protein [Candidatus Krumholzibacteria bacterium]